MLGPIPESSWVVVILGALFKYPELLGVRWSSMYSRKSDVQKASGTRLPSVCQRRAPPPHLEKRRTGVLGTLGRRREPRFHVGMSSSPCIEASRVGQQQVS